MKSRVEMMNGHHLGTKDIINDLALAVNNSSSVALGGNTSHYDKGFGKLSGRMNQRHESS